MVLAYRLSAVGQKLKKKKIDTHIFSNKYNIINERLKSVDFMFSIFINARINNIRLESDQEF